MKYIKDKVAVIMPVYNTPVWKLNRSVMSVLNQTHSNTELIIADDKSTHEDTLKEEIRLKDEYPDKIKLLFLPVNSGPGVARNVALDNCDAEYVTMLDSDDAITPNYTYDLYSLIKKTNTDMVICGNKTINEDNGKIEIMPSKQLLRSGYYPYVLRGSGFRLIKKEKLDLYNIRYPGTTLLEDMAFVEYCNIMIEKKVCTDINGYMVYYHSDSTSCGQIYRECNRNDICFEYIKKLILKTKMISDKDNKEKVTGELAEHIASLSCFNSRNSSQKEKQYITKICGIFIRNLDGAVNCSFKRYLNVKGNRMFLAVVLGFTIAARFRLEKCYIFILHNIFRLMKL